MQTYSSDIPKIEEFVKLNGRDVLEVGCGGGSLSSLLVNKVESLTAIDPDKAMIEAARKSIDGVDFRIGFGEKLEFSDKSFDIVLFVYSLHHQDCFKALGEAKRVLRNDGHILIIEPADDGEYTQFVSIFEADEITRIRKTLAHIKSGSYPIIREEVYFVNYPFSDDKELYHHFIDNYMVKKDAGVIEKMKALLRGKNNARPIVVKDKVNIFLQKYSTFHTL